jgi:Predicted ATPases
MIDNLQLEGFAIFKQPLQWRAHGGLNRIIGEHDTGKTHLLKLLDAVSRAVEACSKKAQGPDPVALSDILATKLRRPSTTLRPTPSANRQFTLRTLTQPWWNPSRPAGENTPHTTSQAPEPTPAHTGTRAR